MKNKALTTLLSLGMFALVLGMCPGTGEAQFRELGPPEISSRLELVTEPLMPARVYLTKLRVGKDMNVRTWTPFRLSPSDVLFPIRTDNFYRERFWYRSDAPNVLEVLCRDRSHFILLKGKAEFDLPPGTYRVEAYRGYFHVPVVQEFELKPGERRTIALKLVNWAGPERDAWLSSDSHIHITRSGEDDERPARLARGRRPEPHGRPSSPAAERVRGPVRFRPGGGSAPRPDHHPDRGGVPKRTLRTHPSSGRHGAHQADQRRHHVFEFAGDLSFPGPELR